MRSPFEKGTNTVDCATDYFSILKIDVEEDMLQMWLIWEGNVVDCGLVPVDRVSIQDELYRLDNTTDGPKTREVVRRWARDCTRHHPRCRVHETASFVPTRLLKINNNTANTTFRLVLRSECQEEIRYIALSHIWGNGPVEEKLRLLGSTYDELRQEKPINYLPKTFRDTMIVAQYLEVIYVWIDSLCIIQDSKEDWHTEAATMHDVYRHACITVSALSGEDEHAGLFYERDLKLFTATAVKIRLSAQDKALRYYYEHDRGWDTETNFQYQNVLVHRAWCLQE
ncbi:hypothetical protein PTT_12485 [Pyrenophora teres f. teres 0-1]|uniref:Heterokaryon incompatibility domain-containing protein n=1 Tax=Pyrenophora teres f. teres (strain 0-1) TaxID=861557 RepID=E3RTX1_PYRTT|nr:hypothetical protein PTT_12485 [Pyrenophora teres f. teres 0-1]